MEAARLMASDAQTGDDFGRTVFMRDDRIVVGAPGMSTAYVFDRQEDGSWAETGKLQPGDLAEGAEFGGPTRAQEAEPATSPLPRTRSLLRPITVTPTPGQHTYSSRAMTGGKK